MVFYEKASFFVLFRFRILFRVIRLFWRRLFLISRLIFNTLFRLLLRLLWRRFLLLFFLQWYLLTDLILFDLFDLNLEGRFSRHFRLLINPFFFLLVSFGILFAIHWLFLFD
jgi:hypothetical protein